MLRLLPHGLIKNKAWLLLGGCNRALPHTFSSYLYEGGALAKRIRFRVLLNYIFPFCSCNVSVARGCSGDRGTEHYVFSNTGK